MKSGSFKNVIYKMCREIMYFMYLYKYDLALISYPGLICHKAKPNKTKLRLLISANLLLRDTFFLNDCV